MSPSTYCPNCGATNSSDSIFCEQCGYQMLTGNRGKPTLPKPRGKDEIKTFPFSSDLHATRRNYRGYRNRHSNKGAKIAIIAIFFAVVLIGGAIFILPKLDPSYILLGHRDEGYHIYDNPAMTEAEFIIDNAYGSVHVFFSNNYSDQLVWIRTTITGRSGVSIEDARQFETFSYGNRTLFMFNSVGEAYSSTEWSNYRYEIEIELNTNIVGSFDIQVGSGEINFHSGQDAKVNGLILDITSGEIVTEIYGTTFLDTQGTNVIKTTSGDIYSHFTDLEAENSTSWDISSISGSIHLETYYSNEPSTSKHMSFDLDTISGEITYEFSPYLDYNSSEELSLGYTMDAYTQTGYIGLVGFGNETASIEFPYTSLTYGSALLNFDLSFNTISGSIEIWKR